MAIENGFLEHDKKRPLIEDTNEVGQRKKLCISAAGQTSLLSQSAFQDGDCSNQQHAAVCELRNLNFLPQVIGSERSIVPHHDGGILGHLLPRYKAAEVDHSTALELRRSPRSEFNESVWDDGSSPEDIITIPRICFGVLLMVVESSSLTDEPEESIPVDLGELGDMVMIKIQDSGKYAGLIKSAAIRELLDDPSVQINATLLKTASPSVKSVQRKVSILVNSATIRIVIAGEQKDKNRVGALLAESDLFLQHPYIEECGELEYRNPHYLLRPGALPPKLESAVRIGASCAKPPESLTEVNKSRVQQIFDYTTNQDWQASRTNITSPRLKSCLKKHQITAVAMMLEKEWNTADSYQFPSLWEMTKSLDVSKRYRSTVTGLYGSSAPSLNGGVLADDMGLGKTLSALALICTTLDDDGSSEDRSATTLVVTTKSTLPGWQFQIAKHVHNDQLRSALYHGPNREHLAQELNDFDLILTTYETLRSDVEAEGPLSQHQFRRIILDEAHHIRNRASQVFKAVCRMKSYYRWCLTGTPIHNSLDDYGALLSFLRVPGFNTKPMFDTWVAKPIQDKKPEGFTKLRSLVRCTCLRRTKETLGDALELPQRHEHIEHIYLGEKDQALYNFFKERSANLASGMKAANALPTQLDDAQDGGIICLLNFLRLICNHGKRLLPDNALRIWKTQTQRIQDVGDIIMSDGTENTHRYSSKVIALLSNLVEAHTQYSEGNGVPVKSVVFSYWSKMLDILQDALSSFQFETCRIDGSTSLEERTSALRRFNEDANCSVMLATIGSAGEGLDLTAANHVHLMEPHWNPMAEAQAVDRVYRIGQEREVFVTRYIVPNSIETYIQWVQQQKLKLISRFDDTEGISQADIEMERLKKLQESLQ